MKQWVRNYSFVRYRETSHCQVRLARLFWGQQSHNCHLIVNFSPNSDLLGHFFPLFWSCPAASRYPYFSIAICIVTSTSALGLIVRSLVLCWFWPFVLVFSLLAWFYFFSLFNVCNVWLLIFTLLHACNTCFVMSEYYFLLGEPKSILD